MASRRCRRRRGGWRIAAGILALILTAQLPAGARESEVAPEEALQEDVPSDGLERYLAAAEGYRDGRIARPLQALSQWSLLELEDVARRFQEAERDRVRSVIRRLGSVDALLDRMRASIRSVE